MRDFQIVSEDGYAIPATRAIELLSERKPTISWCADKDDCLANRAAIDMAIWAIRKYMED